MTNTKKPTINKLDPKVLPAAIPTQGNFMVVNTNNVKGLRINTSRISNYALSSDTVIQLGWGDGVNTSLAFPNAEAAKEALESLDKRCL